MTLVEPVSIVPVEDLGRVHFIGIGGAGMSGIARIMLKRGIPVSGSDAKDSPLLASLAGLGATIAVGHAAANVAGADTVVVSTAIRESNPELVAGRAAGARVLHRSAALASLMSGRRSVTVAGTHGKTTTTSMLTVALQSAGADPSYCIGGQLVSTGLGADEGSGDIFVAEVDESDGSFLNFAPDVAVVTNIEADHLDNYATFEKVEETFAAFAERISPGGLLVVCADDPGASALAAGVSGCTVRTYGESAGADYAVAGFVPRGLGSSFTVGGSSISLGVPGAHNMLNAAAAFAVATELGFDTTRVVAGLAAYQGARRRLEAKGEAAGVRVFDSYAHHPTELAADLRAIRSLRPGRIVAVFQPHLFSRTRFFGAEFGAALGLADQAVVLDVYPAREDPISGVTGELVARAVPHDRVIYEPDFDAVPGRVAALATPGDVIITMGAGDVTMLGPRILERLAS